MAIKLSKVRKLIHRVEIDTTWADWQSLLDKNERDLAARAELHLKEITHADLDDMAEEVTEGSRKRETEIRNKIDVFSKQKKGSNKEKGDDKEKEKEESESQATEAGTKHESAAFYVAQLHTALEFNKKTQVAQQFSLKKKQKKSWWRWLLDIFKKIFDAADDVPSVLGLVLKTFGEICEFVGSFCLGGLALPVDLYEAGLGMWKFFHILFHKGENNRKRLEKIKKVEQANKKRKENNETLKPIPYTSPFTIIKERFQEKRQLWTRLISTGLTGILGTTAAGVATTLIIGTALTMVGLASAALIKATIIFPPFLPGLLLTIYGLSLWRRSRAFQRIKTERETFMDQYNSQEWSHTRNQVAELKIQIQKFQSQKTQLLKLPSLHEKINSGEVSTEKKVKHSGKDESDLLSDITEDKEKAFASLLQDQEKLKQYLELSNQQKALAEELAQLFTQYEQQENAYQAMQAKFLEHEAKVAFTPVEIFLLSFVVFSMTMGVVIGLNVVSFGGATLGIFLPILGVGVLGGLALKYFEYKNEKKQGALTQAIRTSVLNIWNKLAGKKEQENNFARSKEAEQPLLSQQQDQKPNPETAELVWLGVKVKKAQEETKKANTGFFSLFCKTKASASTQHTPRFTNR